MSRMSRLTASREWVSTLGNVRVPTSMQPRESRTELPTCSMMPSKWGTFCRNGICVLNFVLYLISSLYVPSGMAVLPSVFSSLLQSMVFGSSVSAKYQSSTYIFPAVYVLPFISLFITIFIVLYMFTD